MKKRWLLILALCMVFVLAFALVACGNDDKSNVDEGQTPNRENTNIGSDTNTGVGGGGTQTGNNTGAGNNTNTGSGTTQTKTMTSAQAIIEALGTTYKISTVDVTGYTQTAASDGTYFLAPSGTFAKKLGENKYHYYSDLRNGKYHQMGSPNYFDEGSLGTITAESTVGKIYQFAGETISYQSQESVTIAGRSAKKYTYDGENVYGYASFHEEITVDDLTGACLKYSGLGRAGDGFTGGTREKADFEVTEFTYGANDAAALAVINTYKERIDVYEWDPAYFTQAGLSAMTAPTWEFWNAYWDHRTDRGSDAPELEMNYRFYTEDADGTAATARAFIETFYNAGAQKDEYGTQRSFDYLVSYDDEDHLFDFYGYVGGYEVYVGVEHNRYVSPKAWRAQVRITKVANTD